LAAPLQAEFDFSQSMGTGGFPTGPAPEQSQQDGSPLRFLPFTAGGKPVSGGGRGDHIEILSYSFGAAHSGPALPQDLTVDLRPSRVSPGFFLAAASGTTIPEITLTARTPTGLEYLTVTFGDVLVTGFRTSFNGSGAAPSEQITFVFMKIDMSQ